jgi:hypothetical protein
MNLTENSTEGLLSPRYTPYDYSRCRAHTRLLQYWPTIYESHGADSSTLSAIEKAGLLGARQTEPYDPMVITLLAFEAIERSDHTPVQIVR